MRKKIVVVGSLNLDLVAHVNRMPAEGETLLGTGFATYPGGKGANQAVAAARLGGDVAMLGCLGNDIFAERLRRELKDAGVDDGAVLDTAGASGSAVILVSAQGANSIVVIPGANFMLQPQHLDHCRDLLAAASVILSQLEVPLDTVMHLGTLAAELRVPFVLDPAPAQKLTPELLRLVTWLTPNEAETVLLLEQLGQSRIDMNTNAGVSAAADALLATGVRNVVLKLGGRGVYLAGKDVQRCYVATFAVHAVDTTAAGDAFNGGFAYALADGVPPLEAAHFACAVAAVSVTRAGAQPSMPSLEEVKLLLQSGEKKPPVDALGAPCSILV